MGEGGCYAHGCFGVSRRPPNLNDCLDYALFGVVRDNFQFGVVFREGGGVQLFFLIFYYGVLVSVFELGDETLVQFLVLKYVFKGLGNLAEDQVLFGRI